MNISKKFGYQISIYTFKEITFYFKIFLFFI